MSESAELIERYQQAYEAANGKRAYKIAYERGWFVFRSPYGGLLLKKRRSEVERMTRTLEFRATPAMTKERELE